MPCWLRPNPISNADSNSSRIRLSPSKLSISVAAITKAAQASVQGATAQRDQADAAIKSAQAEVERIESILHDLILVSPRTGRVQYQLARNGEVVAAGGKVLTILDLQDVYMTIFLPAASAAKLEIGGEARDHFGSGSAICHSRLGQFCRGRRAVHAEDRGNRRRTRKADVSRQAQTGRAGSEAISTEW